MECKFGYYINGNFKPAVINSNINLEYFKNLKQVLHISSVKDFSLVRIGSQTQDGGYIMVNDFYENSIAYSFGISDDISWDNDMADKGYDIYMYDHTINAIPFDRREFHFFKEGIAAVDFSDLPLKTLEYYLDINKHTKFDNMILKIDIEGAEWNVIETLKNLKQFSQIIIEFHNLLKPDNKKIEVLNKLNQTHSLVHLHGNNCGLGIQLDKSVFPDILEVTYINKDKYETYENRIVLPLDIDVPNNPKVNDIILGEWNKF